MLQFLGVLFVAAGFFLLFQESFLRRRLIDASKGLSRLVIVLGALLFLLPMFYFYAEPGYQYFLVYPTGTKDAVFVEGYTFKVPFTRITPWQKYIDVKVVSDSNRAEDSVKEIEGVMRPIGIRFIDQVTADMFVSIRFQLPQEKQQFITLAVKFRSMENLVYNTLVPTVEEQAKNLGYMYSAQDYISGAAQGFRQTYDEMLKSGSYAVNKIEIRDSLYDEISQTDKPRRVKDIQIRFKVEKLLENGVPKRIPHEITENQIIVSQVIVDDVDLDPEYRERLKEQKRESAQRQLEQQKIETAKIAQQRILAEGERDKASERVTREKEQVQQLIAIETDLKRERTNRELAEIQLATERLNAEKQRVSADAQSYQNAKLVQAGLTPQERATFEKDTKIGVSANLKDLKFPQVMIVTGEGAKGLPLEQLIGAAMAKQLLGGTETEKK